MEAVSEKERRKTRAERNLGSDLEVFRGPLKDIVFYSENEKSLEDLDRRVPKLGFPLNSIPCETRM